MVNSVVIMGRLVRDPTIKSSESLVPMTSFTVAVDRRWTGRDNKTISDYLDCVAWRQTAEFICKYFHKGDMIAIQGWLQAQSYEDRNGTRRKRVEIICEQVDFTGRRPSKVESEPQNNRTTDFEPFDDDDDDNLPF